MTRSRSEMLTDCDKVSAEPPRDIFGCDVCLEASMPVSDALNAIEGLSTEALIECTRATIAAIEETLEGLRGERKADLASQKVVRLDDWRQACLMEGEA